MEDSRNKRQKTKLRDRAKIASLQDEVQALKQQIIALTPKYQERDSCIAEEKPKSKYFNNYVEVSLIGNTIENYRKYDKRCYLHICSFSFLSFIYS